MVTTHVNEAHHEMNVIRAIGAQQQVAFKALTAIRLVTISTWYEKHAILTDLKIVL